MLTRAAQLTGDPRQAESCFEDWILSIGRNGQPVRRDSTWVDHGPFCCFFRGILFDRHELAREQGVPAESAPADLILHAYARDGEAALTKLRGSFVVALADRRQGRMIVMRDQLGSHPLFYAERDDIIFFASSARTLVACPGISRALNRPALADHLCNRWPDPGETFFSAVRRVPPGCRAIVANGWARIDRYWLPAPDDGPVTWLTDEETQRFDEVFDRAVARCVGGNPSAIFLSGGIDSISVAAVASDQARRQGHAAPRALSLAFPDPSCDERDLQRSVAHQLGLKQDLVEFDEILDQRPLIEQALRLNEDLSAPLQNPWQPAYLGLSRLAKRQSIDTILTGHGGDEWLCVTPYLTADLLRRGSFVELAGYFSTLKKSHHLATLPLARNVLLSCGVRPLIASIAHRFAPVSHDASRLKRLLAGDPDWIAPDAVVRGAQKDRAPNQLVVANPKQGFYFRELRSYLDHPLVSMDAEERHEIGQRIGVRYMHPFTDADLVELLYRVQPRLLNAGGRTKGLVRGALARRFPKLGFERQRKVIAVSYYQNLLRREAWSLADLAGDFPALSGLGIVDGDRARAFVEQSIAQPSGSYLQIWDPINLEVWVRAQI